MAVSKATSVPSDQAAKHGTMRGGGAGGGKPHREYSTGLRNIPRMLKENAKDLAFLSGTTVA